MIRIFISHSSAQKSFARRVVNYLGLNNCYFDENHFEPAKKNKDQILDCINNSKIFVLLISNESLNSSWVMDVELPHAKRKFDEGQLNIILPYIIDININHSDERIPLWIRKGEHSINLTPFENPILLARDIQTKHRELIWNLKPQTKIRDSIFVGRNLEIEKIETNLYSGEYNKRKVIIVSGRNGVGRRTVARKFLFEKLKKTASYEPFFIELSSKDSIEDFILKTNDFFLIYDRNTMLDILEGDIPEKQKAGIELLNYIFKKNHFLFIIDRGACVMANQKISSWFIELICNDSLLNGLNLFLISTNTPFPTIQTYFPQFISLQLYPLSKPDREKLFYAYYHKLGLEEISAEKVNLFVNKLHGSPEQIYQVIESIASSGIVATEKNLSNLIELGDKAIIPIMKNFENQDGAIDLLILLSKFEFISYQLLEKIVEQKDFLAERLHQFSSLSIIENFGPNYQYIKLDTGLTDYIHRSRLKLSEEYDQSLKKIVAEFIKEEQENKYELNDVSDFMFSVRQLLLGGYGSNDETYLIPSFFVKTIIELYYSEQHEQVITFCDRILRDSYKYYDEIVREINYWLCQSLAKLQNERFHQVVRNIDGLDHDFLYGFYYRCRRSFEKAEERFQKVLEENPLMPKARREMVTVLLGQKRFHDALDYAKQNYNDTPTNTYNIDAYFRCLVRKRNLSFGDKQTLNDLIYKMRTSYDEKSIDFSRTMKAEYKFHVDKNIQGAIIDLRQIIEEAQFKKYPQRVLEEIMLSQGIK